MQINYIHKMGSENKDFITFKKEEIPENILQILLSNSKFSKPTVFGQKGLGDPDEIEKLIIVDEAGNEKEFCYYNKGIHYMFSGDTSLQPVFQVFTFFQGKSR